VNVKPKTVISVELQQNDRIEISTANLEESTTASSEKMSSDDFTTTDDRKLQDDYANRKYLYSRMFNGKTGFFANDESSKKCAQSIATTTDNQKWQYSFLAPIFPFSV